MHPPSSEKGRVAAGPPVAKRESYPARAFRPPGSPAGTLPGIVGAHGPDAVVSSNPSPPLPATDEAVTAVESSPAGPGSRRVIHAHDRLGSTSDEARRLAREGAADGTVVWARMQTAGRGRRGRTWASPEGNLHASVVLHCPTDVAAQLGFVAALAVADAVDEVCGVACARLKWPNDVLLDGAKLAGLLLEVEAAPRCAALVLGVGINLRHFPTEVGYAATSLHSHGVVVTAEPMLGVVLGAFDVRLECWRRGGFDVIREAWLERGHGSGDTLQISVGDDRVTGVFIGLDRDGSLLAAVDGRTRRFVSAEVLAA